MDESRSAGRMAVCFASVAFALEVTASVMYGAAAGVSDGPSVEPSLLLAAGTHGASLIRWGSLIDMAGYLCMAPVVLYLRNRYRTQRHADLFAFAGLALVVVGAIGAVSMATAAPPLMREFATADAAHRQLLLPVFATLYRAVVVGMWQTLETIPAAVWLLGTASAARRQGPRSVFVILLVLGSINAVLALYRLVTPN
ncbi:MAG: hypothetical protein M3Z02_11895 [Actinomycetota bacterium]|nr:hypothetical protein [Actinomycetota bacterium]